MPTWSVMIPTYNSEKYLAETLASVVAQGRSERDMEIVVVDNCSTDKTKAIVDTVGQGRVKWLQNPVNIGMMNNFNQCIKESRGELIHILNSDDVVNQGYYAAFEAAFAKYSEVCLVSCNAQVIDENSKITSATEPVTSLSSPSNNITELLVQNKLRTPAVVVRKAAYNSIGGFDTELIQTADWDMWIRIIHNCKGLHLNLDLCKYREHSDNGSSRVMLTGENILDTYRLYGKFKKMKYTIDETAQNRFLLNTIRQQYMHYNEVKNSVGMQNMLNVCRYIFGYIESIKLQMSIKLSYLAKSIKN